MTHFHLLLTVIHWEVPAWYLWVAGGSIIIALIICFNWVANSAEGHGIEIGKLRATGKLYVLTENDVGKIYLSEHVLYTSGNDNKEDNIGVAYMREDGRNEARWYQLPYDHAGKPVRPIVGTRCKLSKGEKAEYLHFERENRL